MILLTKGKEFIRRERLYILMCLFVAIVYAANYAGSGRAHQARPQQQQAAEDRGASFAQKQGLLKDKAALADFTMRNFGFAMFINLLLVLAALATAAGVGLDIKLVLERGRGRGWISASPRRPDCVWSAGDIVRIVVLFLFFMTGIGLAASLFIAKIWGFKAVNHNAAMMFGTAALDIITVALIADFIRTRYSGTLQDLGLGLKNFFQHIRAGLLSYIAFVPVLVLILLVTLAVVTVLKYEPPEEPMVKLFLREKSTPILIFATILATVAGPIAEEIFFRAFAFGALRKRFGVFAAYAGTSLVFAGLHTNVVGFFPILALGLLLAFLYEKTGSLIPSITVHIIHNSIMISLAFVARELYARL